MPAVITASVVGGAALQSQLGRVAVRVAQAILLEALKRGAETVLADARRRVAVGPQTRGTRRLSARQRRQVQRQQQILRGIRAGLFLRQLPTRPSFVGYAVQTGTRATMGIVGRYYYPAHVELGHAAPGHGVHPLRAHRAARRARRREFGDRRTPPHPYLRPALEANATRIVRQIAADVRAGLARELGR